MKKKTTKLQILALIMVLAFTLCACSSKTATNQNTETQTEESSSANTDASTSETTESDTSETDASDDNVETDTSNGDADYEKKNDDRITSTGVSYNELENHNVVRVVDGDTFVIKVDDEDVKVRLIGIDTPESVASDEYLEETGKENTQAGEDASAFTKSLIEGTTVYLEFDASVEDQYGRLLAYVYLEDGQMLQDILLTEGYAQLATYPPNVKYVDHFVSTVEATHMETEVQQ